MAESKELPKGWGEDGLTKFISIAQNNEIASLESSRELYSFLIEIDSIIYELCNYSLMQMAKQEPSVGFLLFVNSLNHYRALVRLVTSGQCVSSYPLGRASIEAALYGWYLIIDPSHDEKWHSKPKRDDKQALREWSQQFKFSTIVQLLEGVDGALSKRIKIINESAIDYGAHPNENSLYNNLEVVKAGESHTYVMSFIHQKDSLFYYGFKFAMEVGLAIVELFRYTNEEEVQRLFKLNERLVEMTSKYSSLLPSLKASIESDW